MVNNADWFRPMSAIDLLKDIGVHFKVHTMQSRESVKHREGLSFTELAYQMLQAHDFYVLHRDHNVRVQVGGSDQWGNILGGVELIHRRLGRQAEAVGVTVPLVTVGKQKVIMSSVLLFAPCAILCCNSRTTKIRARKKKDKTRQVGW